MRTEWLPLVKQCIFLHSKFKTNCTAHILSNINNASSSLRAMKKTATSTDQNLMLKEACKHASVSQPSLRNKLVTSLESSQRQRPILDKHMHLADFRQAAHKGEKLPQVWLWHSSRHQFKSSAILLRSHPQLCGHWQPPGRPPLKGLWSEH